MQPTPSPRYNPALAGFATFGAAWVFVLVTLGALTTSLGAGMIFADWPLSNGSLNPPGWLTDIAMFSEHSHRLSGATMGLITIVLTIWIQATEPRAWLRRLAWFALALVIIQGLLGGQRVRLDAIHITGFEMSLGQMLRIPHGILAQVFVCTLFAIAASLSKSWLTPQPHHQSHTQKTRTLAIAATTLLFLQLIVAAAMRHNHAGLAIPTFPNTPNGILGIIPTHWDFRIALAFAHRSLALAITIALIALAISLAPKNKPIAALILTLLAAQITLGALSIWNLRDPLYTTAHVVCGASLLATTCTLTWWLHRAILEGGAPRRRHSEQLPESIQSNALR